MLLTISDAAAFDLTTMVLLSSVSSGSPVNLSPAGLGINASNGVATMSHTEASAASRSLESKLTGSDRTENGVNQIAALFSTAAATINSSTTSDAEKIDAFKAVASISTAARYSDLPETVKDAPQIADLEKAFYTSTGNSTFIQTAVSMADATSLPNGATSLETELYDAIQELRDPANFATTSYSGTEKIAGGASSATAMTLTGSTALMTSASTSAIGVSFTYGISRQEIENAQIIPGDVDPASVGRAHVVTSTGSETINQSAAIASGESIALPQSNEIVGAKISTAAVQTTTSESTSGTSIPASVFTFTAPNASTDSHLSLLQEIAGMLGSTNSKKEPSKQNASALS